MMHAAQTGHYTSGSQERDEMLAIAISKYLSQKRLNKSLSFYFLNKMYKEFDLMLLPNAKVVLIPTNIEKCSVLSFSR